MQSGFWTGCCWLLSLYKLKTVVQFHKMLFLQLLLLRQKLSSTEEELRQCHPSSSPTSLWWPRSWALSWLWVVRRQICRRLCGYTSADVRQIIARELSVPCVFVYGTASPTVVSLQCRPQTLWRVASDVWGKVGIGSNTFLHYKL